MKLEIESTDRIVVVDGARARVWNGLTENGVPVLCLVTAIAVAADDDDREIAAELEELAPPPELEGPAEGWGQ